MRTLTDVFAPGTPSLPEGLRTLHVSPSPFVEPGMTVHANFTFRNLGGGTATGFRVRFRLPEGLTYLVGSARVDESPIDERGGLTSLLQSSGADIGDVPPGGERRISLAYSVAPTIENGTQIALQAAVASFEVPLIGSNIVRLVVRSRPTLAGASTKLTLTPVREAVPGAELTLAVQLHNSGQSSAHDVIVLLPVPANTAYVPQSARVEGRTAPAGTDAEPFGSARPSVVAPALGPGATLDVAYRVRIDGTLEDATPIVAQASVCSQELAEFALAPVTLKIPSKPAFDDAETSFRVECDDEVTAGQRLRLLARARNSGTSRARGVKIKLALPDGLVYSPGTRTIDGAPAIDRERDPGLFELGEIEPGRAVDVALQAVVRAPVANGHELRLSSRVEWSKGERSFERAVSVRSTPAFPSAFNRVDRDHGRQIVPGDAAAFTVRLEVDAGLERLRVTERDGELTIGDDGAVALGTLEPSVRRTLHLKAAVAAAIADQSPLRVRATLRTSQLGDTDLGAASYVATSRPRFSVAQSRLTLESSEVLRPNRTTTCVLTLANEGTDRGRDVRVRLQLPDPRPAGGRHERDAETIVFGEIPAQESKEASLHLRLIGTIGINEVLDVGARVSGINVVPFSLATLQLATHAEASFAEGASLTSQPAEAVDAGEDVLYTLALRNCGDGAARRLTLRLEPPTNAVYAPGTTTVNDVPLLDFAGTSPLLAPGGLTLADVGPGVEVVARLRAIVNTPLPAGSVIESRAAVSFDEAPEMSLIAEPLRVRSAPALPIVDPQLPFSVLDAAAGRASPGFRFASPEVLAGEATYIALPAATPVRTNGSRETEALPHADQVRLAPPAFAAAVVSLDLMPERLDWIVEYLEEARFRGVVAHLIVLRALFPTQAGSAEGTALLRRHGELLGELVDRLFIKLRVPDVTLERDDLETEQLRESLRNLLDALAREPAPERLDDRGLRLFGVVDAERLSALSASLDREKLVTAALMGTSLRRDGVVVADFRAYRNALGATLSAMTDLSPTAFEAALHEPGEVELEVERENVLRALAEQRNVPA